MPRNCFSAQRVWLDKGLIPCSLFPDLMATAPLIPFVSFLQGGKIWEKAGVNVSVVYGTMPAEAYRAATGTARPNGNGADRVPFFAAGISSVMHPHNPFAPTFHFNYRWGLHPCCASDWSRLTRWQL